MKKFTLLLLFITSLGYAQEFTDHIIDNVTNNALSTEIVDLDNDGDFDIIAAFYNEVGTTNTGKLKWYENDGAQNYTMHTIDATINGAIYLSAADANGDGNLDILLNAYDGNAFYVYLNLGGSPLNFAGKLAIDSSAIGSNYCSANDFDGDSVMDAVSANYTGNELAWYKYTPPISITKNVIDAAIIGVSSVETGDMDGDGDIDLVVTGDDQIFWYENQNSNLGTFTKHSIAASTGFTGAITAYMVDFDVDGDMDIVGSASGADEVAWFENDGSEVFTKHTVATSIDYASYAQAVDFNNDGHMDIVASATITNELLWFENDGSDTAFATHVIADNAAIGDSYAISLKDIDNDGDIDIAITSPGPDILRWFENHFTEIPTNDLAVNAIAMNCGDVMVGNTTFATIDQQVACGVDFFEFSRNQWYTYTGTGLTEDITITTCLASTNFDTYISVFTGTPGSLVCLDANDDDMVCSDDLLSTLTFTSDGTTTYYIEVKGYDATEQGDFNLEISCAVVAVDELEAVNFSYYPNPTTGNLHISANENINKVVVTNILGQEVKQIDLSRLTANIDLSDLNNGTYFVKVIINDKIGTFKIIKN